VSALNPVLARSLVALGALGAAFVLFTQAVAAGATGSLDLAVARAATAVWLPALEPLPRAVAVLGGLELTAVLGVGLAVLVWRSDSRAAAAALLTLPLLWILELVEKLGLHHPPPLAFSHTDGPSVVTMLYGGTLTLNGSYPSGHMMRSVLIYGLGAFVVRRLAAPPWMRTMAAPVAAIVVGLMALDRIYLGVHWQSDIVGGLLMGGAALAAAIAWLDRPRTLA
jgi:undecaprenyl-diphosphatase